MSLSLMRLLWTVYLNISVALEPHFIAANNLPRKFGIRAGPEPDLQLQEMAFLLFCAKSKTWSL